MSKYDYDFEPEKPSNRSAVLWNLLTFLVLVCTGCIVLSFVIIFINPQISLNPFPPPTLPPLASFPTATITSSVSMPPTWTPTIPPTPTITNTPVPTRTLPPTPTRIPITPTATVTTTPPPGGYPFQVQSGSPVAIANIYHPELGCDWMGVGGQTVDLSGGPVIGLIIRLGGKLPGVVIPEHMMSLTGIALNYGRAGYEFTLADKPIASNDLLWLQLLDQSGSPVSERVYFDTYDSCEKNLIIINFKQVKQY